MRSEQVLRELPEAIGQFFNAEPSLVSSMIKLEPSDSGFDAVVQLPGRGDMLGIIAVGSTRTLVIRNTIADAAVTGIVAGIAPIIVAPFISEAVRADLMTAEVGFVDLSGNAYLRTENLLIDVRGRPNRFPERGRPSSPFTPGSSQVARILLTRPNRWWHQFEIADTAALSKGQISKTIKRLLELELVDEREDRAIKATDSWALLDAWVGEYERFRNVNFRYGHFNGSGVELMKDLASRMTEQSLNFAFTGLASAYAYEQFTTFRLASLYVADLGEAADAIGMRGDQRGANVQLIEPRDPAVYFGLSEQQSVRCVSPIQTYLDLQTLPERAAEAAEHMRSHTLTKHFAEA